MFDPRNIDHNRPRHEHWYNNPTDNAQPRQTSPADKSLTALLIIGLIAALALANLACRSL